MAAIFESCCGTTQSDAPLWPPRSPPHTFDDGAGGGLIAGYLKRLNKPGTTEEKWVVRWLELEMVAEGADGVGSASSAPVPILSVYKTSSKTTRLNSVLLSRVKEISLFAATLSDSVDEYDAASFVISLYDDSSYRFRSRNRGDSELWVEILKARVGKR